MINVSVIIPVYNSEKYLRECMDSLINQSLENIEIICINDFSSDNSLEILKGYAQKDCRIKIINNSKNLGAGNSRNIGIKEAKGEYLSILDSDDIYDRSLLKSTYEKCCNEDADLCIYEYSRYKGQLQSSSDYTVPLFISNRINLKVFNVNQIYEYIFQIIKCGPSTKLYKREFILENNIQFQDLNNANDTYFGNIVLTKAKRIVYLNTAKPLVYYRTNVSTSISKNRDKGPTCIFEAIYAIEKTLIKDNFFELCKRSFYTYALKNLIFSINSVTGDIQKELYYFIQTTGLEKLGMDTCTDDNFLNTYDYYRFRKLFTGSYEENLSGNTICRYDYCDLIRIEKEKTEQIFQYLTKQESKCALWGKGQYQQDFLKGFKDIGFSINYIIENNDDSINASIKDCRVINLADVCSDLGVIIITNAHYGKEIYNKVKEVNKKIRLLDVDSFYRFRVPLNECIYTMEAD